MTNTNMLLDNFSISGSDMEFLEILNKLTDATSVVSAKGKNITFLSLCRVPKLQIEGKLVFYVLTKEYVEDFVEFGEKLRMGALSIEELGEELAEELVESTGLLAVIEGEKYIISRSALTTLCQRACISGDTTVNRSNFARDLHLADGIFSRSETINFVYRVHEGVNKIFAAFSSDFTLCCKQDVIVKALKHSAFPFEEWTVRSYKIDNFITEIELSLPNNAGIIIKNSDVGLSSLTVRTTFNYDDKSVYYSEHALRHTSGLSLEKFLKVLEEAKSALESSDFNNEMLALKEMPIMDYADFNEYNPFHKNKNIFAAEDILIYAVYELFNKVLSKKAMTSVTRSLIGLIESEKKYSYYDIAKMLFSVPDFLDLDAATISNTRKALANFPDVIKKETSA